MAKKPSKKPSKKPVNKKPVEQTELLVTCNHCGSRNIAHGQGYIVKSRVARFRRDDRFPEELDVESFFGIDEVDLDADIGDSMYSCLDCGAEYTDGLSANVTVKDVKAGSIPRMFGDSAIDLRVKAQRLVEALRKTEHGHSNEMHGSLIDDLAQSIGWFEGMKHQHL